MMKKESISALEGGFLQVRKGRRPIGVDRLLGRVVGKQSVSDLVQKKIVPSKFAKRAAEEEMTIPWFVAELAFDILEKTAAAEERRRPAAGKGEAIGTLLGGGAYAGAGAAVGKRIGVRKAIGDIVLESVKDKNKAVISADEIAKRMKRGGRGGLLVGGALGLGLGAHQYGTIGRAYDQYQARKQREGKGS